ncbi:hypothetical protein MMC30_003832 [Trapelia coarctata]|nr:hypothetical protein [Trapelia coarctata]
MRGNLTATVVSAGRMMRAVKVRSSKQTYNARIQKHFTHPTTHLVADPTSALRTGDVIRIEPEHHSRFIKHVVTEIISPWGPPIDERPRILSREEREALHKAKRERRDVRRAEKERALREGSVGEGGEGSVGEGGEGAGVEVEEGARKGEGDRQTVRMAGRIQSQRERALHNKGVAERVQRKLDTKGIDVSEVDRRMEQVRI